MQFTVFYQDQGQYVFKNLEAPSFVDGPVWDIGFFCHPYMIETNMLIKQEPAKPDKYFSYFQKLMVFFLNRKTQKFNQAFGKIGVS